MNNLDVNRDPFYFNSSGKSLFGVLHYRNDDISDIGVVICAPIGHENNHTHRSLRHLADQLSNSGIPTLRFDYYSIGNSEGNEFTENIVEQWIVDIASAVETLKEKTGVSNIVLVGVRIGALLSLNINKRVCVQNFILWHPILDGKKFIRELSIINKTSKIDKLNSDNYLEAAGFLITKKNQEALKEINSTLVDVSHLKELFVISPNKTPEIEKIINEVNTRGIGSFVESKNYQGMFTSPHLNKIPFEDIKEIVTWISRLKVSEKIKKIDSIKDNSRNIVINNRNYLEKVDFITRNKMFTSQLLCLEENNHPIVIIVNTGLDHNIGTNRLSVILGQKLGEIGYSSIRVDLSGIGESIIENLEHENQMFVSRNREDIALIVNEIHQKFNKKVILMGVCSGGQASYISVIDYPNLPIVDCIAINSILYRWKDKAYINYLERVDNNRYVKKAFMDFEKWKKLLMGKINFTIISKIFSIFFLRLFYKNDFLNIEKDFKKFTKRNCHLTLIYAGDELGIDVLNKYGRKFINKLSKRNNITLLNINDADHVFSSYESRMKLATMLQNHLKNNNYETY